MITTNLTYWLIDNQSKIKALTKLFTYLIAKGIENVKFDYIEKTFIFNSNNCLSNKLMEFSIHEDFFTRINIVDASLLSVPILNIIKDLKSYKGKKVFPDVYFIFKQNSFLIHSLYDNGIELSSITTRVKDTQSTSSSSNMFRLESIISSKSPDVSFDISVEKLNILLNNTYVKENSHIKIENNAALVMFDDAHGNNKILKCDIHADTRKNNSKFEKPITITIENFIIKDLMKFFKDNTVTIGVFLNEEKVTYGIVFDDMSIKFKLISHMINN